MMAESPKPRATFLPNVHDIVFPLSSPRRTLSTFAVPALTQPASTKPWMIAVMLGFVEYPDRARPQSRDGTWVLPPVYTVGRERHEQRRE
jgi:hypothetical protein